MQENNQLVTIRPYRAADKNFIFATWLRGLYYGESWFRDIPKDIFMKSYHKVLDAIMSRQGVEIKIACLKDDEDVILGYSVGRTAGPHNILDWVFVKSAWRKIGIAKKLVNSELTDVTHLTKIGRVAIQKLAKPPVFNPFLI